MSDDLVTRLRAKAHYEIVRESTQVVAQLLSDAADEIERLRTLLTTDDAMVERVARAICNALSHNPDALVLANTETGTKPMWRLYEKTARAALEAALGKGGDNGQNQERT